MNIHRPTNFERFIVKRLVKSSDGLLAGAFWRQFGIAPHDLLKGVQRLAFHGVVEIDGPRIALTSKGRDLAIGAWLISESDSKLWRIVPSQFVAPMIEIGVPIVPKIAEVDPKLLPPKYRDLRRKLRNRGQPIQSESQEKSTNGGGETKS